MLHHRGEDGKEGSEGSERERDAISGSASPEKGRVGHCLIMGMREKGGG